MSEKILGIAAGQKNKPTISPKKYFIRYRGDAYVINVTRLTERLFGNEHPVSYIKH